MRYYFHMILLPHDPRHGRRPATKTRIGSKWRFQSSGFPLSIKLRNGISDERRYSLRRLNDADFLSSHRAIIVFDHWKIVGSTVRMLNKSRFPDQLMTTYVSPRLRRLLHDFRYIDPVEGIITCRKGLEIDGASFGRIFSPLFGDQHDYDVPATPHDQLYADNRVAGKYLTRRQCDRVFYRAMQYAGFSPLIAFVFYVGVRLGGWFSWLRYRRRDSKKRKERT